MSCSNNLKQQMLAVHNFHDTNGSAPAGCFGPGATPEERLGWTVALLPYLEQDALFKQFDCKKGYAGNLPAARTLIKTFLCPAALWEPAGDAVTTYVAMAGIGADAAERPVDAAGNGFMGYDRATSMAMIKDGTSSTIALIETHSDLGPWARGGHATLRGSDAIDLSFHGEQRLFRSTPSGMNAAMADGSVRFIHSATDRNKLAAAITIAGGESINLD